MLYQIDDFKVAHNKIVTDNEIKVFGLERNIANLTTDLATLNNWRVMMEDKYQT